MRQQRPKLLLEQLKIQIVKQGILSNSLNKYTPSVLEAITEDYLSDPTSKL